LAQSSSKLCVSANESKAAVAAEFIQADTDTGTGTGLDTGTYVLDLLLPQRSSKHA
jgi:hypothetical protein